jgi:benzoyl-CoA reductase subunit B
MADTKYPTESLKSWEEAKQIRMDFYKDYYEAHDKGGLRWGGGAWTFDAIPAGLGEDVFPITSEPYGASLAFDKELSMRCMEAVEKAGYARDLCAYMRNYWGSIMIDEYAFNYKDGEFGPRFRGGDSVGFPKPDFLWQDHICCSHAKWYQIISELEGGVPMHCIDVGVGPYTKITDHGVKFVVDQLKDGIDWLEKVTGREYDDELLIKAVYNHCRSTSKWAEICTLNKNIPAPLDEKTMYSLYALGTLHKASQRVADYYDKILLPEVQDRVKRGIAAVGNEQCRVMSDTQPPWSFLKVFRYLEKFGCISIGSLYTFGLIGIWDEQEDGTWGPKPLPQDTGVDLSNRDDALEYYVRWELNKPEWQHFYTPELKTELMLKIAREWKLNGIMLHYNRGCEGLSVGIAENRLGLMKEGFPVMSFEGNMGDEREFDEVKTMSRIDAFMETLGIEKIED